MRLVKSGKSLWIIGLGEDQVKIEQDPMVYASHVLSLPFVCEKTLAKKISLIREMRKCRNKGKQSNKTK